MEIKLWKYFSARTKVYKQLNLNPSVRGNGVSTPALKGKSKNHFPPKTPLKWFDWKGKKCRNFYMSPQSLMPLVPHLGHKSKCWKVVQNAGPKKGSTSLQIDSTRHGWERCVQKKKQKISQSRTLIFFSQNLFLPVHASEAHEFFQKSFTRLTKDLLKLWLKSYCFVLSRTQKNHYGVPKNSYQ